jgi:light-regulated signal transduction histidine kinase (bacteriophytochrome)
MLTITPIQNNKYQELRANPQSRPVFNPKADSFERVQQNISFGGSMNLRFPLKETEKLFAKALGEIELAKTIKEKAILSRECVAKFRDDIMHRKPINQQPPNKEEEFFECDRDHEMASALTDLYGLSTKIVCDRIKCSNKKHDEFFKYSFDRLMGTIKRFEFFLDKGLDTNTMKPNEVFKMAMDSVSEKASQKNIKINVIGEDLLREYESGISIVGVQRVPDYRLYTIWSNLMQNSVKYSPNNSEVEVEFSKIAKSDERYFVFSIKDHGIGIPKAEQEKVLVGERASNAIEAGIQGTGYGLRRVNRLVKDLEIKSPLYATDTKFPGTEIRTFIRLKDD